MKKIFKSILVFVIFGLILVNFTGCLDKNLKEVDEANIIYTGESIKWDMVKNADGYEVSINGNTPVDTKALSYPYKQGGDFTFEITAYRLDKDGNKQHSESVIVSFTELGIVEEIKIKDGVVTWNAVEGANAYKIRLNGTELAENFAVREFAELNYGKNSIEIRAINVDNSRAYSVWSDILQFELLSSPTNIKYDSEQKLLYWDVVKDASKYEVVIDGTRKELVVNNSFAFDPNKKDFTVSVKAVGDEMNHVYDSPYCEPKEFIYLPQVENLTMKDGELVWNGSEKAVGYKLKIDNILQDYVLDQPKFSNIVPGESYYISILQVSDQTAYYSEWSEPVSITICVAPQIRYEDGVIAWTGVSNATGYKVNLSLNGNPINVPNLSNQETIYLNDFSQPGTYKISVQTLSDPEKGSFDSKFSNEIEVIRLEKPSTGRVYDITTQINETYITFDSVLNAYNYEVKINGTESKVLSSSPFYFKDSQHYTDISAESAIKVEIYSVGDGQSHSDGKVVLGSTTGLEFTLTKVATPTTVEIENSTIKWDYIPHANGYVVDINGKTYYPQTNQLILPEGMSAGEHNVHVRALGNGSEYISSNTSKGITFTKLQTPSELEIVEGVLKWRAVNGAEKYFVKVGEYTTEVVNNSFVIEDQYISTSGVAIYVKAIGNNSTKVDSDMSNTDVVIRLKKVTGLQIVEDNTSLASSKLVWNAVDAGDGVRVTYRIKVGSLTVRDVVGTSIGINELESYFAVAGRSYGITIQALGNQKTYFNGEVSDVLDVQKLETPVVSIKDKNIIKWEEVTGTSKYAVYVNDELIYTGGNLECEVNLTKNAVIKVMALGDLGVNTINSAPFSVSTTTVTQTKPTISVVKVENGVATVKVNTSNYHEDTVFEFIGGTEKVITSEYTAEIPLASGTTTSITVIAHGGFFNDSLEKYVLDSVPSSAQNVTLLLNPSVSSFDVGKSGSTYILRYDSVSKAVAYELNFEFIMNDGTTQTLNVPRNSGTTYSFQLPEGAIGFTVTLRALGNGTTIISALDTVSYTWSL